jgi:hypothetical protein
MSQGAGNSAFGPESANQLILIRNFFSSGGIFSHAGGTLFVVF